MSTPRRYTEQEIAAIFERAARAQEAAHQAPSEGLTLEELQRIGTEAGIAPAFVAQAAAAVEHVHPVEPPGTYLGVPFQVARTADLPGPLTDAAWERLVVETRETFAATGKTRRDGSLRKWYNGNLKVLAEPTATGHRLRLRTMSADIRSRMTGSAFVVVFGLFMAVTGALEGSGAAAIFLTSIGMLLGAAVLAGSAFVQGPRWARTREQQMEHLIAYATEMVGEEAAAARDAVDAPVDQQTNRRPALGDGLPTHDADDLLAAQPARVRERV